MSRFRTSSILNVAAFLFVIGFSVLRAQAAEALLPEGSRLAVIGDSITEQKQYSKFIEIYLLACAGRTDMKVFQFGWGGERAEGFAGRLANDLADFKPTVATTCYGMNDGSYRLFEESIGAYYEKNMRRVIEGMKAAGVTTVVVGTPGAVDTRYWAGRPGNWNPEGSAVGYNANLKQLADIDQKLATEYKMPFANVHAPMIDAMAKAKAALGNDFDVCGRDGVHPGANGHLVMAYAFLKALGCDGNLATIEVNMKGSATASAGNKVLESSAGTVKLQSTRYPFVHSGDAKSSGGTRSITPFLPFNAELNRWTLKVVGLDKPRAKVTWGAESHEFTKAQLEGGINLAAEFEVTPFDAAFNQVLGAVGAKENFETSMIKGAVTNYRTLAADFQQDAELRASAETFRKALVARQVKLHDAVIAAIKPVEHTITVTPMQ